MIEDRRRQSVMERSIVRSALVNMSEHGGDAIYSYEVIVRPRAESENLVRFGAAYEGNGRWPSARAQAESEMQAHVRQLRLASVDIVRAETVNESIHGGAAVYSYRIEFKIK